MARTNKETGMTHDDILDLERATDEGMVELVGPMPTDYEKVAQYMKPPVATGVIDYFPDALEEVAYVSLVCNEQHNPGIPMFWNRAKSRDEANSLMRHFAMSGKRDLDGCRHSAKVVWRAMALLQKEIEDERSEDTTA